MGLQQYDHTAIEERIGASTAEVLAVADRFEKFARDVEPAIQPLARIPVRTLGPRVADAYKTVTGHEPRITIAEMPPIQQGALSVALYTGAAVALAGTVTGEFDKIPGIAASVLAAVLGTTIQGQPPAEQGRLVLPPLVQPHTTAVHIARMSAAYDARVDQPQRDAVARLAAYDVGNVLTERSDDPGYLIVGAGQVAWAFTGMCQVIRGESCHPRVFDDLAATVGLSLRRRREGTAIYKTLLA